MGLRMKYELQVCGPLISERYHLLHSSTPATKRSRTVTYSKPQLMGMMYQLLSYCNTTAGDPSCNIIWDVI